MGVGVEGPEKTRDLVIRARGGSPPADQAERLEAFGELVTRFQDMAYGYAYSVLGDFHLAQDAAQEAFITAFRRLEDLREPDAFAGWLRRIVQTACRRLTRGKEIPTVPLAAAAEVPSHDREPGRAAEKIEMRDEVLRAIARLPQPQREVTTLFYINGYSQKDIADFLEVPATTVKNRLAASRKRLKRRMLKMVEETLHEKAPDERFSRKVIGQLLARPRLLEIEGHPVREVFEVIRAALPEYEMIEGEEVVDGSFWAGVGSGLEEVYQVGQGRVLRTETTVTTFRAMVGRTPPVRLITAGRVFRAHAEDAAHQKVFHQLELLCLEAGADQEAMKAALQRALRAALGPVELKWQEEDYHCVEHGLDASVKLGDKWLEIAGCGVLKAETLRQAGFDPQAVSGFAFGLGLERLAMLKHDIADIRELWAPPYVPE